MKANFTPAHALHVLEKKEKVKLIAKLQKKFLAFVQNSEEAEKYKTAEPILEFSKTEKILMLETFVFAKEAVKGIQIGMFGTNE